jgi:putative nucleotidyltransferase with HDIG domain
LADNAIRRAFVESLATPQSTITGQQNIRKYFREVMEKYKLPPLPIVASKVLSMIEDPDLSLREICRVLADDPALAARVLAISRSVYYAQRTPPKSLQGAIQVVGLRALRYILIAAATQGLFMTNNNISAKLWSHSLAVALACRILSERANYPDGEQAFLTGLLHDIGEMILFHGDQMGFERIVAETQKSGTSLVEKEKETYAFDHAFIGLTLLDSWNIDAEIGKAVLKHHEAEDEAGTLAEILATADHLSFRADLGFFAEAEAPPAEVLSALGCGDDESLAATVKKVREAFDAENALFQTT